MDTGPGDTAVDHDLVRAYAHHFAAFLVQLHRVGRHGTHDLGPEQERPVRRCPEFGTGESSPGKGGEVNPVYLLTDTAAEKLCCCLPFFPCCFGLFYRSNSCYPPGTDSQ